MSLQVLSRAYTDEATSRHRPDMKREVRERLGRSGYLALKEISCSAADGVFYRHDLLPSQDLKQVAQEVASGANGVGRVIDRIIVSTPERRARCD